MIWRSVEFDSGNDSVTALSFQGESDNSNDDSQMTVIEMMKMFHRENLPQADVEIKITEVIVILDLLLYETDQLFSEKKGLSNIVS